MIENMKGIFFDLDDTLINFGYVTKEAWHLTCQKMMEAHPIAGKEAATIAKEIHTINETFWGDEENRPKGNVDFRKIRKDIISTAFHNLDIQNEEAITFLLDNYSTYKEEAIYIFPNVYETLAKLKEMGSKLVLITNGDGERQRGKVNRFDLEKYFDLILIEGEQEFGKPDVRVYQKALDYCGIKAEEACMVGDNYLWEVETPIKYGMKGVWVNFENQELPKEFTVKPDLIVNNVSELLDW